MPDPKWPKMLKTPTVTIRPDGHVYVERGEYENCSCREAATLSMVWAVQNLTAAIFEDMTADRPVLSGID